ncbi:MAG: peptide chain release factor N(5)-glutamine methyltransferase [Chloroflexi bacterium]|nr:peptide chain release factor N(5)-glutamine methyltransferase [Chloroflexota bacterium]MBM4453182.1 peptide chain release factor N(5)-glutamine methyltransferase [Chloroflexota bacterium]
MTLAQALQTTTHVFRLNSVDYSHLEARVLLQHISRLSPAQLYSESDRLLTDEEIALLQQLVERRLLGEPSSYIVGHKEFYGHDFYVDQRVLIPRPETELLVEAALQWANTFAHSKPHSGQPLVIADIGTGCGAIAVALALGLPESIICAIDISPLAIDVARINCARHNVTEQVVLLQGNLLEPLPKPADLVIANLPYIKTPDLANLSPEIARFEPLLSIHGGEDGLRVIESLLSQLEGKILPHSCLLLEIGRGQGNELSSLLKRYIPHADCVFLSDYGGVNRVVKITFHHV